MCLRETRYYLRSLPAMPRPSAMRCAPTGASRTVCIGSLISPSEDESRVHQGHADQNQAFLRRLGLDLLRQESIAIMSIKDTRLKAG